MTVASFQVIVHERQGAKITVRRPFASGCASEARVVSFAAAMPGLGPLAEVLGEAHVHGRDPRAQDAQEGRRADPRRDQEDRRGHPREGLLRAQEGQGLGEGGQAAGDCHGLRSSSDEEADT
eukprot:4011475-Pyramimonas_sp.AAC.1